MKEIESEDVITVGTHVIVQKLNYKKVYRVSETGSLALGKEEIKMSAIIGKPFWTTFKVIAPQEKRNEKSHKKNPPSTLIVADKCDSLEDLKNDVTSGYDNRSINDDGKSQKLSKDDILGLRDEEKYIRKKERKYCQYLSVHKPTLSSLHNIYLKQDPVKIYGLRMDTLAQLFCYSDIKSDGTFILYDSGSAGLAPAGMMSRIGSNTSGNLIYLHSGDHLPQMPIVRAMNFSQEQLDRLTVVNIFDFLATYYSKHKTESESTIKFDNINVELDKLITEDLKSSNSVQDSFDNRNDDYEENKCNVANFKDLKRKISDNLQDGPTIKKSRKVLEIERAVELLSITKADGFAIVAREHPLSIVKELLPFVQSSRPIVIYHAHREPLQETYVALKQQNNIINLRLFSNFLRSYQILPDRTHPDILTNDCGGYILTGYIVS